MKALRLYGALAGLLLALVIYADFRGGGGLESAMERWWAATVEADLRAEYARPLPPALAASGGPTAPACPE